MINSIFYCVSFYLICGVAFVFSPGMKTVKKIRSSISRKQIAISVLSAVLALLVIFLKIRQNNTVYTWDWAGYWKLSVSSTDQLFSIGLIDSIKNLLYSINNWDYNSFLPFVIALPLHFIGYSYVKYVMVVAVFFFIPAAVLVATLAAGIVKNEKPGTVFTVTLFLNFVGLFYYRIILRGMIDVAIVIPMAISLMYLLEYDFKTIGHLRNIFIAGMLVMAWISRRYAVFYIVGFVCAMVYSAVAFLWKERNKKAVISTVVNFAEIGGCSLLVLLVVFRKFLLDALGTNREAFSSYGAGLVQNSLMFVFRTGILYWIIIFITLVLSIKKKETEVILKLAVLILSTIVSFSSVQMPGIQHILDIAVPVLAMVALLMDFKREGKAHNTICMIIYAVIGLCFATIVILTYLDAKCLEVKIKNTVTSKIANQTFYVMPYAAATNLVEETFAYPLIRTDMETLGKIVGDVNASTVKENDTYVAVAEQMFNSDTMRNYSFPEVENSVPSLSPVSDVDLRDGFPKYFLSATYVLACNSNNCTYNNGEEILRYINSEIKNSDSQIGKHYELMTSYRLDDDMVIDLYRKVSEYSEGDLEVIATHFDEVYPNHDELFRERIIGAQQ